MSSRIVPSVGTTSTPVFPSALTPGSASDSPSAGMGFIGLGNMGSPMARRLLSAQLPGRHVFVQARNPARTRDLVAAGAIAVAQPRELAAASSLIFLMLPDLPQIRSVLEGPEGLLAGISSATTLVVMSSVAPDGLRALVAEISLARPGLISVLDAPVSGGTEGAQAGTLAIMVGGDPAVYAEAQEALATMGTPILLGPLGAGEVAKACNQMIVAATMTAIAEASVIAERSGIDLAVLLPLLGGGYAGSRVLETKQRAIIEADYTPTGIAAFMVKDLAAAADAASATGTAAPQLESTIAVFTDLVAAGLGHEDLAVVHRFIAESQR